MWEADANTYKVDGWMVRFLLNHALPIAEKGASFDELTRPEIHERGKFTNDALAILTQPTAM